MIDRHGKPISVAYAEHELIWIRAAIRLPRDDRTEAFQDIAAMTGRTEFHIRAKATEIRAKQRATSEMLSHAKPRRSLVPFRATFHPPRALPSDLRQPSRAQLMGCR